MNTSLFGLVTAAQIRLTVAFTTWFVCLTATVCAQVLQDTDWEKLPVLQRIVAAPVFENPITFVGDLLPDPLETHDLWSAIDVMHQNGSRVGVQALELFAETYTNSVWLPSLKANLGAYYRNTGRYSLALQNWQDAWESTKLADTGEAKQVADFALVNYTRLLASLGRVEELQVIFKETQDRTIDSSPLQQTFDATREGFRTMAWRPDLSYRCGSLALKNVARLIQPENANLEALFTVPSPESGFSLSTLKAMADFYKLGLVAAYRVSGDDLIVPSVVHWKVEHYAAITEQQGDKYKVEDPTFEHSIWMDAETINAEASGYFLIPASLGRGNWVPLSKSQTDPIIGRGYPVTTDPTVPEDCPKPQNGNGGSDSSNPVTSALAGNPAGDCEKCNESGGPFLDGGCASCDAMGSFAMPVWKVVEPYIDVWLVDTPLFYTKSQGDRQVVRMSYKQRNTRPYANVFSFGPSWECNLLTYFFQDSGGNLELWAPGGGKRQAPTNNVPEYKTGSVSSVSRDGSGGTTSVSINWRDYSVPIYSNVKPNMDGSRYVFLSQQIDRYGRTNLFNYATVSGVVHLTSVTDYDGNSLTLSYTNTSYPHQVTQIDDPYGKSVKFKYDSSGRLTNITDAAGISSSFVYETSTGWITNLVTLYGTTSFKLTGTTTNFSDDPAYTVNRSALVSEPNGSKQLFIYSFDRTDLDIFGWDAAEIPTLPTGIELPTPTFWNLNNSFYWNRQQYAGLNGTFLSTGNFADLTEADYKISRRRHWLVDHDIGNLRGTLDVQRDPSPDGVNWGRSIWFDYAGKGYYPYSIGTNSNPSTISYVLPNGQTYYEYYQYNLYFNPTLAVTSYGDGSTSRTNTYVFDAGGRDLAYEIGPNGNILRGYSYNTNHQVLTYTNAVGDVTKYSYTNNLPRSILQSVLPSGLTNIFSYDGNKFVSQIVQQPINSTNTYTYSGSFVRGHTTPLGLSTTNYWDNLQRLTGVLYPEATNNTVTNIYTVLDLTATKDRLGNWTYYGYNAIRQKIAETNANSIVTRYGYCDCGALMYVTNAFGNALQEVTSFGYDNLGNRTFELRPDGTSLTNWFDSRRKLIATSDSIGSRWFGYNNQGLLVGVTNSSGLERWTVYDIEDRVYSTTDANGVSVTNTYDALGRLLTRTYPDSGAERFGYNVYGLSKYTNQLNFVTSYGYDAALRKTKETNANSEIITYAYNAASDLTSLTDGKSQVTTWNYDLYGRVTNKVDQASVEVLRYQYDSNNRLTNRWSKAKNNTVYSYDAIGNLTNINYPSSTDVAFAYDALNRITNMTDAAGTSKFTYYAGGLLNTEDGPWSSDTVTYTYTNRLPRGISVQQSTGSWTNGFTYDAAKRLSTALSSAGTFTYTYQTNGLLVKKIALPNTSYITNTFDSVGRMTNTWLNNSSHTTLDKMDYLYNPGNQRTRATRLDASYYTNTYDNIGQLKWADSTVAAEDRGYLYDAAWNLSKRTNNGATTTLTVDGKNQLTNYAGSTYGYDNNGNLTQANAALVYDDENRLLYRFQTNSVRTDYTYDGLGRMRKQVSSVWYAPTNGWQATGEVRYVYVGMRVIQERNATGVPTVSYTRGNDLSGSFEGAGGIGGLLSRSHAYQSGSGTFTNHNYYHADGNGNITYLVNTNQTVAASYRYDPFGNTISSSGTLASDNTYRFSSKELTGLNFTNSIYYYGYRFYDPNLQRWLNRDPIGEVGGINLYGYVLNNPVNDVDPIGLSGAPGGGVGTIGIGNPANAEAIAAALGYDSAAAMNAARAAALAGATIGSACKAKEDEKEKKKQECLKDCDDTYADDGEFCNSLSSPYRKNFCWRQAFKRYAKCRGECNRTYK